MEHIQEVGRLASRISAVCERLRDLFVNVGSGESGDDAFVSGYRYRSKA